MTHAIQQLTPQANPVAHVRRAVALGLRGSPLVATVVAILQTAHRDLITGRP